MSIQVRIPMPLRRLAGGQAVVSLSSPRDIGACLQELDSSFPGFKARLVDDKGELHQFVNIYLNGEDVRFLQGLATPLKPDDEVSIVPAVAGGGA